MNECDKGWMLLALNSVMLEKGGSTSLGRYRSSLPLTCH